jgi:hypothetical protein
MDKILDAKKRLILSILNGSNSKIQTIDKYNITWNDIMIINTNIDKIKPYIKDYLDQRQPTKIYTLDVLTLMSTETNKLLDTTHEYSNKIKMKHLSKFYDNHMNTLKDRRFDKRYELPYLDKDYLIACDKLVCDYFKMKLNENKIYKKNTKNIK